MAMHRALFVQEVLLIIFGFIRDNSNFNPALAALARTCREFKEVALNVLWAHLCDLSPLVRCLPKDSWKEQGNIFKVYEFTRPLKHTEWAILRGYARRVHTLSCPGYFCRTLDEVAIHILCYPPTTHALFPNLQELRWGDSRKAAFPLIHRLLGARTTTLEVDVWGSDWGLGEMGILSSFTTLCPDLDTVVFPPEDVIRFHNVVSDALCSWGKLKRVSCGVINETALLHLRGLQTLQKLKFSLDSIYPLPFGHFTDAAVELPSGLRVLAIEADDLVVIARLARRLHVAVTEFSTIYEICSSHHGIRSYFTTLKENFHHDRLHKLELQGRKLDTDYTATVEDFTPLGCFKNLIVIDIELGCPIILSGEDLLDLASSWPSLTWLSLNRETGWCNVSTITPQCLSQLTTKCAFLSELEIAIDPMGVDVISVDRPSSGHLCGSLSRLDVLDSAIDPVLVAPLASFFSDVYPNLATLQSWRSGRLYEREDRGDYSEIWMEVDTQLGHFRSIREQERRWWQGRANGGGASKANGDSTGIP